MPTGALSWYDPARGRGSIAIEGGGELFVKLCPDQTARAAALRQGDQVRFESAQCEGLGRTIAVSISARRVARSKVAA